MLYCGVNPESYIAECTLVYEDKVVFLGAAAVDTVALNRTGLL